MEDIKLRNKRLNSIGWAVLLIWWGLRWSVLTFLPNGSGLLGTSILLLGANAYRKSTGQSPLKDNTFLGAFSLVTGGVLFIFDILNTSFQPPVFETIMVGLGIVLLGYGILGADKRSLKES